MEAAIVHFPHPGGEHNAHKKRPIFPWNTAKHQRKFMRAPGAYVDDTSSVVRDNLVFWGEWEAPSRVVSSWAPEGHLPTYLHEPFWEIPDSVGFRQNTDPWVFGDCFRYSNCKQLTQSALRYLPAASLILFGSSSDGRFVLDTCFVARSSSPLTDPSVEVDEAFQICTIDSLREDAEPCRLHVGATPSQPAHDMFSFVPCLPEDGNGTRFERPVIELEPYVNPKSWQSPKGAKTMRPIEDVQRSWEAVVDQVRSQGLEIGVWFETPPKDSTLDGIR